MPFKSHVVRVSNTAAAGPESPRRKYQTQTATSLLDVAAEKAVKYSVFVLLVLSLDQDWVRRQDVVTTGLCSESVSVKV